MKDSLKKVGCSAVEEDKEGEGKVGEAGDGLDGVLSGMRDCISSAQDVGSNSSIYARMDGRSSCGVTVIPSASAKPAAD